MPAPIATAAGIASLRALARSGRCADAADTLQRAWQDAPHDPALATLTDELLTLAARQRQAGPIATALAGLPLIAPQRLVHWAQSLLRERQLEAACMLFARAIAIEPRVAAPGGVLATALRQLDDVDLAGAVLARLAADGIDDPDLLRLRCEYLIAGERRAEAGDALDRLARACPNDAYPWVERGRLALARDDRAQARAHLLAALQRHADNVAATWELAQLDDWQVEPAQVEALRARCRSERDPKALAGLHAILGRVADRQGDVAGAAQHAAIANSLLAACTPAAQRYDPAAHAVFVDAIVRDCTPEWLRRLAGTGDGDRRPVFVVGLPRSGTTLLERMLAAHPGIIGVGEQAFAIAAMRRALRLSGASLAALTPAAVQAAAAWHRQQLDERVQRLELDTAAARIVDKMPDNYLLAGWLRVAFPHAAIIHCQRDPRDVALSCWLTHFSGVPWSCSLDHIAGRIEHHRRLLRHWRTLPGLNLLEVHYEDIIATPRQTVSALLAAMGLPWHDDVLAFAGRGGHVTSASHRQVREPLHGRSIGRWHAHRATLQSVLPRLHAIAAVDGSPPACGTSSRDAD
ncbi:MAG: sulfotransferase [Proteobacteria bacterium]|nr:sulfotransferase [Pseudomonadota bacterium]